MKDHDRLFTEDVPSNRLEILDRIVNKTVLKLVRCSWFRPEQVVQEWNIPASSVFNFSAGPLIVTLESGLVVGFASIPEKASVTVWVEETEDGYRKFDEASASCDDDMFPIDAADPLYSNNEMRSLTGKRIVSVKLLKREAENALLVQTLREAGLVIEFENGVELILSHGLHDNSDDFAVIFRANILPSISQELQEIPLVG